jgi:uncharacterized protein with ParB-like and HNH nuclease domain
MKMRTEKRELDKIYKRRNRYEIPDYQRQEVWDVDQKRKLIDSTLAQLRLLRALEGDLKQIAAKQT